MLGFMFVIVTLQTQTNEAYINGEPQSKEVIQAQWSIWLQVPKLMFGNNVPGDPVTSNDLLGIVLGQGGELVYLSTVTARKIAGHASRKMDKILSIIAFIFLIAISIFDFYTDAVYGTATPMAHFVYACFCTFVIGFFPTWSLTLIEHGIKQL